MPDAPPLRLEGLEADARQLVFERFASTGAPPSPAESAATLGVETPQLLAAWRALHEGHHLVLGAGGDAVRMAHPFSAAPMGFVLRNGGDRLWWGGCAWDSFGICAALSETLELITRCPACGRPLSFPVGPEVAPPPQSAIRVPRPAAKWWDDVVGTCSDIRLFCDAEEARNFAAKAGVSPGEIVPATTMWALAQSWYGDRLDPDYQPQSPEQRQRQLTSQGLTGQFWQLS